MENTSAILSVTYFCSVALKHMNQVKIHLRIINSTRVKTKTIMSFVPVLNNNNNNHLDQDILKLGGNL